MRILLSALITEGIAEEDQIFRIQSRIQRLQTLIAIERERLQKVRAVQQRKRELERHRKDQKK